jgi:hypothetical protein
MNAMIGSGCHCCHQSGRAHTRNWRRDNGDHANDGRHDGGDHPNSPFCGPSCHCCCCRRSGHVHASVNTSGSWGAANPLIGWRGGKNMSAKASDSWRVASPPIHHCH